MRNRTLILVAISIGVGLIIWTFIYLSSHSAINRITYHKIEDKVQEEFITRKKDMMLKEYDSLFAVYDRETSIVYNFKGWAITLIILSLTAGFSIKTANIKFLNVATIFILAVFYVLEVSERSSMLHLIQELRDLEKIFNIEKSEDFNLAASNYQFRDLNDSQTPLLNGNIFKAMFDPRLLWWNYALLNFYFIANKIVPRKYKLANS
jgi:hypothetical protein